MANKGAAWERAFCYQLSQWWTGKSDSSVFWRTSQSGGRATVRGRKGKRTEGHCGDVCATDKSAQPFTDVVALELKRGYNHVSMHSLFDRSDGCAVQVMEYWIAQAEGAAERSGAFAWMLVHKRDGKRVPVVYFPAYLTWELIGLKTLIDPAPPFFSMSCWVREPKKHKVKFCGTTLELFLSAVTPKTIVALSRKV